MSRAKVNRHKASSIEMEDLEEQHFGPIWFIPGNNQGKYPFCHSVYIEGAGILIDPASDRERLVRLRKDQGVKMVWLSHAHEDHFMHLDLFDDIPLWISDRDLPPLSSLEIFLDWYGESIRITDIYFWIIFLKPIDSNLRFKNLAFF